MPEKRKILSFLPLKLPPVRYGFRPSLTFIVGSWLYEKLKSRG